VDALIQAKADVRAREIYGRTPRQLAEASASPFAVSCVSLLAPAEAAAEAATPYPYAVAVANTVKAADRLAVRFRTKADHPIADYLQIYVTVPGGWMLTPRMGAFAYAPPGAEGGVEISTANMDVGTSFRVLYVNGQDQRALAASDIVTVLPQPPRSPWGIEDATTDPAVVPDLAAEVAAADQALHTAAWPAAAAGAPARSVAPAPEPSGAAPAAPPTVTALAADASNAAAPETTVSGALAITAAAATKDAIDATGVVLAHAVRRLPPWQLYPNDVADVTLLLQTNHRLRQRTFALAGERELLLAPPPPPEVFAFNLDEWTPIARLALREDSVLDRVRFQLVPALVSDTQFWCNYFYHALRIREEELKAVQAALQAKQAAGTAEAPVPFMPPPMTAARATITVKPYAETPTSLNGPASNGAAPNGEAPAVPPASAAPAEAAAAAPAAAEVAPAAAVPEPAAAPAAAPSPWTLPVFKQRIPDDFEIDLDAVADEATQALEADPALAAARFKLVPGRVSEATFWRVYFYLQRLQQAAAAPAPGTA